MPSAELTLHTSAIRYHCIPLEYVVRSKLKTIQVGIGCWTGFMSTSPPVQNCCSLIRLHKLNLEFNVVIHMREKDTDGHTGTRQASTCSCPVIYLPSFADHYWVSHDFLRYRTRKLRRAPHIHVCSEHKNNVLNTGLAASRQTVSVRQEAMTNLHTSNVFDFYGLLNGIRRPMIREFASSQH